MIPRSIRRKALFVLVALLTAMIVPVRAQDGGPMTPPASTKFPTPPKASKPEPPSIPPEEIIRRFAAKEDEMLHALMGYSFQRSVRLEEIGPDNKPTGQLEIVTQQMFTPDGRLVEKPVRRQPSTLHVLDIERGTRIFSPPRRYFRLRPHSLRSMKSRLAGSSLSTN